MKPTGGGGRTRTPVSLAVVALVVPLLLVGAGPATGTSQQTATPAANGTIHHGGERVTLEAATGRTVSGTTNLQPGEPLSIRIRSTSQSPFLRTIETTTGSNGSFTGQVDLSTVEPETRFEIVVLHNGTDLTRASGIVVPCSGNCAPTPTATETPGGGGEDATGTVTDDWPSSDEWLADSIVLTYRGRTVMIPINVDDSTEAPDSATITIGDHDGNYIINATVRDTSGDGRVALLFNTANAGFDAPTLALEGDDELEVHSETSLSSPLDAGNYDITVYRSDSMDEEVDIGTLVLNEALNGTVTPGTTTQPDGTTDGTVPTTIGNESSTASSGVFRNPDLLGLGALAAGGILAIVGVAVMLGLIRS
jgi:hypothetical protein